MNASKPRRMGLAIFYSTVGLVTLAAAVGYASLRQQQREMVEALTSRAAALASRRMERVPHLIAVTPGSFGEALVQLSAAVSTLRVDPAAHAEDLCLDAAGLPLPELTPRCREAATLYRPVIQLARFAAGRGSPRSHESLSPESSGLPHEVFEHGWADLLRAAQALSLDVRVRLERGDADGALDACVDGLALFRDSTYAGLTALHHGDQVVRVLFEPCARAVDQAPRMRKRIAEGQLSSIREALRPAAEIVSDEAVLAGLLYFGPQLSASERARLPPGAAAYVEHAELWHQARPRRLFSEAVGPMGWQHFDRLYQRVASVAGEPASRRAPVLAEVEREFEGMVVEGSHRGFEHQLRVHEAAVAQLELLALAAAVDGRRADKRMWSSAAELGQFAFTLRFKPELLAETGATATLKAPAELDDMVQAGWPLRLTLNAD